MEDFNLRECLNTSIALLKKIQIKVRNLNYLSNEKCFGGIDKNAC